MSINERVKYLRKNVLKMSQEKFGQKIGLSKSNISNIEIGRIELTHRNITSICNIFNINETWFRTGDGEMFIKLSKENQSTILGADISKNIGERVKNIRKSLNMSRRIFGEKLGVSESVIVNIEYDRLKRPEQKESLYKLICKEFNVNEIWLRTGEGEMFLETDNENQLMIWAANVSKDESESFKRRFVSMLMELDESDWESLEKMCLLLHKDNL